MHLLLSIGDVWLYESRKDGSGCSSSKREWNSQTHGCNDDSSSNRKYIRTQSSSNNRTVSSSSSSQQQRQNGDKDKKTVKDAKKPLRICGDWSEFKSSKGKTYFYNSKTEISQWERPKAWSTDESTSSSIRSSSTSNSNDRTKKESSHVTNSSTVRSRHKMEESFQNSRSTIKAHHNGDQHSHSTNNLNQDSFQSNENLNTSSNNRHPSSSKSKALISITLNVDFVDDENSRMSLSPTNSRDSPTIAVSDRNGNTLHSSLSEPAVQVTTPIPDVPNKPLEKDSIPLNGTDTKIATTRSNPLSTTRTDQTSESEPSTPSVSKAERDQEIQKYYRSDLIQHLTDWPSNQLEKQCLKLFDDYYGYSAKMSTGFIELKALKSNFRILEIKRSILTQRLLRCQQHMKEREDDKLL
ncbi:unnamed protein product [Adineta ricciae]|uniref:WW domain-containing protein n=1 Tax=Adineta ricciae TaxID=249248 RepID=A0A814TFH7_ADIRI|nr:unnamed protein product [Adineta ricciae]